MAVSKYNKYYVYIKPIIGNKYVKSTAPYIFSLLAIIIFIMFAIRPTILTIISLQKNIQDDQQILSTLEKKAKDLTDGKRNLDNLDPRTINLITTRLPDSVAVTNLIKDLQFTTSNIASNTASISALQIQPVTIFTNSSGQKPKQTLDEILFSFNAQDSYASLLQILDNISKTPRLLNMTSVILSKSTEEAIRLSISGKAYYLKE